jgi:dipeptidase D
VKILKDLEPASIFEYFEQISAIPRGSGSEKAISDFMVSFAENLGLWVRQDEAYNIYIKKPASPGYEKAPVVILQGHMDMVCEKNKEVLHDFETEGLKLTIDGDYIRAQGTTLGADNGIAIAYQMAVLADQTLKHPALEILMTTDEERGMTGVSLLHPEYLEGKILINLDTDVEGEFLVSCAGGVRAYITLPLVYEPISQTAKTYSLRINGLLGGHSGADIHLERANAHIVMGRVLGQLRKQFPFGLCEIIGGTKDNVITRECEGILAVESGEESLLQHAVKAFESVLKNEYSEHDGQINITFTEVNHNGAVFNQETADKIIDLLMVIPNGIISFDQCMAGLVQTSLNLGIIQEQGDKIKFGSAIRSSLPSKKQELIHKLEILSKRFGGAFTISGDYPAWEYSKESSIRTLAGKLYEDMYGKEPSVKAIHAGLECGFISQKIPALDMIAFGPDVKDIHSPQERVSISSMIRVYEYLIKLLENIVI